MKALTDDQIALAKNLALHASEAHILAGNKVCAEIMKQAAVTILELVAVAEVSVTHEQVAQVVKELQDGDTADFVSEERKGGYQAALEIVGLCIVPALREAYQASWRDWAINRKKDKS